MAPPPRTVRTSTRLAPIKKGRRPKATAALFDDPRRRVARRKLAADTGGGQPRTQGWALELSQHLRSERQRNEARALIRNEGDDFRGATQLQAILCDLPRDDLQRPFECGKTLAHLAFEAGRVFFLAAFLRAGGEWTPLAGPWTHGAAFEKVAACRALLRGWPGNRDAVARHLSNHRSHPEDLRVFLRSGDVGVRQAASRRKRALLAYVAWMRRRAAGGALTLEGRAILERVPDLAHGAHARAARLLDRVRAPERPASPRAKTPRSRTEQIMRRSGVTLKVLPADDRPAPSPEIAKWLADRGLGNMLAARATTPAVDTAATAASPRARAKQPVATSPRADDLECSICLCLLADPVYTPCMRGSPRPRPRVDRFAHR